MRWSMACISAGRSAVRHGGLSRARYPASYVASVRPVGVAAGRSQAQPACGLSRACSPKSPGDVVFGLFLLRSEKYVVGPAKFDEIA